MSYIPTYTIAEANKRHFTGKKFDSKIEDVLEWADYFRGYLTTHIWDLHEELRENVAIRFLGKALVGSVEQFWFSEMRKTCATSKAILGEFEDSFVPNHKQHLAGSLDSLRECKQEENENAKACLLRLERALARHRRAMEKKRLLVDEKFVMQSLYAVIKSNKITKVIHGSDTLARALSAAKGMAEEEN
jgi:hypothetical protein